MSGLLPEGLLEIMQCPRDAGLLREDVEASQLVCDTCRYRYRAKAPGFLTSESITWR